ncbi:MAG: threonine aldolase [Planctomycetota bacterium]|nr:MAG: threonine aldolase [Planctomycetota bacterium]
MDGASRTFRSDNNAGVTPEALAAVADAAAGHAIGYGDDEWTERAVGALRGLFGDDAAVFFVATGTAANTLAVASLTEPWQRVLCHAHSHWNDDESTAPERLTHCRTTPVHPAAGDGSKLTPDDARRAGAAGRGDVHQPAPGVLTLSNPTEFGTVYTPDEMRALCDAAHALGYRVHVDGARFANAVAHLVDEGAGEPARVCRALTRDAGVDALSFGGTKNGLALGEAVVFFPRGDGAAFERAVHAFPYHRKGAGHLLSKHRFVSAPFAATIADGSWLTRARGANAMARRLGEGLAGAGLRVRFPVQTNGVFVELPAPVHDALWAKGHRYYPFGDADWRVFRLMCSFDTDPADVDALIADARAAAGG